MSYGQNMPWGLKATKNLVSGSYNGQVTQYLIPNGYNQNIFLGDPVILVGANSGAATTLTGNQGYIASLYDFGRNTGAAANTNYYTALILGVFNGCAFQNLAGINPIDPASPGRSYWPAGTQTFNSLPAVAAVIDDPNVVFNIQCNIAGGQGATQASLGQTAEIGFTLNTTNPPAVIGTQVAGDTSTGMSKAFLNLATLNSTANTGSTNGLIIKGFPTDPFNNISTVAVPYPYNNVEVLIEAHLFASRPGCTKSAG